jgi:hypothetical protein
MKFKTGDHVRVIARGCRYFDEVGTVAEVQEHQDFRFNVTGLEPWALWFGDHELILAEAPAAAEVAR